MTQLFSNDAGSPVVPSPSESAWPRTVESSTFGLGPGQAENVPLFAGRFGLRTVLSAKAACSCCVSTVLPSRAGASGVRYFRLALASVFGSIAM